MRYYTPFNTPSFVEPVSQGIPHQNPVIHGENEERKKPANNPHTVNMELPKLASKNEKVMQRISQLQQENQSLNSKNAQLMQEVSLLRSKSAYLGRENQMLKTRLEGSESANQTLRMGHVQLQHRAAHTTRLQNLNHQANAELVRLRMTQEESAKQMNALLEENTNLRNQHDQLDQYNAQLQNEIAHLKQRVLLLQQPLPSAAELMRKISMLQINATGYIDTIHNNRKEISRLKEELMRLKTSALAIIEAAIPTQPETTPQSNTHTSHSFFQTRQINDGSSEQGPTASLQGYKP